MASAGFSGQAGVYCSQEGSFQQQSGRNWPLPKDLHYLSQGQGKHNVSAAGFSQFKPSEQVDPWKYVKECDQLSKPTSLFNRQDIIDLQDNRQTHVYEQSIVPAGDEFHLYDAGGDYLQDSLVYPESEVILPSPGLDCIEEFPRSSRMKILPNSRLLYMGSEEEISDLISMISDLYREKKSVTLSRRQMVIPYFRRSRNGGRTRIPSKNMEAETVSTSAKTAKAKPSTSRKETRRSAKERDMYRKNLFHACESLLSVILGQNRGEMAVLSLKKSGPEISNLLTQISASIVGIAVAVFFSVVLRISASQGSPFSSSKLLSTGLALCLVWLSKAVDSLRDNILVFSRDSGKIAFIDREMPSKVEKSLNQIFFRTLALMAVVLLRYA